MALIDCPECGKDVSDQAPQCPHCGIPIASKMQPVAPSPMPSKAEPVPESTGVAEATTTNGLAVASLVFGILPLFGIGALLAVIFGHVSLGQIKKSDGAQKGRGMAIAGLVLGYIWIAFFLLLLVLAIISAGNAENSGYGSEYGDPQVSGQLSWMPLDTRLDASVNGETAPTVIGQDFDGDEVRIENDGRAKAIVMLAHWCPHCQDEVPEVQAWLDAGGGVEGIDMYSISTAMDSNRDNYPPSEWLDREGWTVPVIRDDASNSIHTAYGSGGFPFWVFVNSDGTVAFRLAGAATVEELELIMNELT